LRLSVTKILCRSGERCLPKRDVDGQTGGNQITSAPGASIFAFIGIVEVLAPVIGDFLMEKGHILVLMQPASC
jgi:hypothetical protein